jgi:hypothetical protein
MRSHPPKYEPLRRVLETAPHPVSLTFEAISELVGGLPPSSAARRQWWENHRRSHAQAAAWLDVEREVLAVDLRRGIVTFS